jgi:metallo-beta-lactamase family protein
METTSGDRLHKPIGPSIEEFFEALDAAFARGGHVVIPTLALERAREILWFLRQGRQAGRLPGLPRVFLDSPMAISVTQIFARHAECFAEPVARCFDQAIDPFALPELTFTRAASQSVAIGRYRIGAVILAGAGMCNGGRDREHLRRIRVAKYPGTADPRRSDRCAHFARQRFGARRHTHDQWFLGSRRS